MTQITARLVKELRERTGLGMMECKKALTETDGDLAKAEDLMRIKSGSRASKVSSRIAAEGAIAISISADAKQGAIVEVNCETDFVGRDASFLNFINSLAEVVNATGETDITSISQQKLSQGETVEEVRQALIMKLGENISLRRARKFDAKGSLASYLHGNRIGVLVDVVNGSTELGKDLAMHIAAAKPVALWSKDVAASLLDREREIAKARAMESGKPENIIDRIVEGSVQKYLSEVTLYGQIFVKDDKKSVEKLLNETQSSVDSFALFVVGEGIEKKVDDFAAEVAAQMANQS
ncbi:MAG: translation elongation factor Ts [Proteobacteria bacterium]|nr:translation elongation factor Ts [Pseudomonadota bacterium]MDA1331897.1 translation elongation factor Ts [Pseudomonadota bacterium]